ncbi:GGDEF domain-containing protein [Selenomonas sp. TAMA-11512]|uniref:GGDEF domain-containing protein n=1 Tax=Selenomonas sp. TAMA-11512 TaxID=3095337 RepID=UPI0030CB6A24
MSTDSHYTATIISIKNELKDWRYRTEALSYDGQKLPANMWEEQQQDGLWKPYPFPDRPPVEDDAKYVWLQTRLPDNVEPGDALFFSTTDQAFRIWVGDRLIEEYGTMQEGEYTWGRRWHVVRLPNYVGGQLLTVEAHSDVEARLGVFDRFSVRNRGVSYLLLFVYDIPFFIGMSSVISLLFLVFTYLSKSMRYDGIYRGFFIFQTIYFFWMIASSNFRTLLFDAPEFWWNAQLIAIYAFLPAAHYMIAQLVEPRYKKWSMGFFRVHIVYMAAAAFAQIFIFRDSFLVALNAYYILVAAGGAVSGVTLYRSMRSGNPYSRAMLFPVSVMFVTCMADGLTMQYRLLTWPICVMALAAPTFFSFAVGVLSEQIRQERTAALHMQNLRGEVDEFKQQAQIDPLTGVFNRYKFDDAYREYTAIAKRTNAKLSLCMLDIDFFKRVNDDYGHDIGDVVLRGFAELIQNAIEARRHVLIRWGGEEFVILCLHQSAAEAALFAESLCKKVEAAAICPYRSVTCSVGVAEWMETDEHAEAFVKRADEALYQAKEGGRNCVRVYKA